MDAHVVVTGAGGFIGGYLARWFAERGTTVTAITRRSPSLGAERQELTWREADLRDARALPDRFDALVHCAAEIPARCPEGAVLYRTNMEVARNVFERALAAQACTVVFMSSVSIYGEISVPVVAEDTIPQRPDPYGRSKRDAEDLLEACAKRGLASALSIRLPGTVGKGSHDNFLSTALARVLAGEQVRVNHPDAPFNNIVHVGDLARFLGAWIERPRLGYAVTNLAAAEPMPVRDVAKALFERTGQSPRLIETGGGKQPFLIALDRARSLGYRPSTVSASLAAFVADELA